MIFIPMLILLLFIAQWRHGQPVLIANSSRHLKKNLWHPDAFLRDFGHIRHDLINCLTGQTIPKAKLQDFWKGKSCSTIRHGHTVMIRQFHSTKLVPKYYNMSSNFRVSEYERSIER